MEKYFVMLAGDEVPQRLMPPAAHFREIIQSSARPPISCSYLKM